MIALACFAGAQMDGTSLLVGGLLIGGVVGAIGGAILGAVTSKWH